MDPLLRESDDQVPALRAAPEAAGGTFVLRPHPPFRRAGWIPGSRSPGRGTPMRSLTRMKAPAAALVLILFLASSVFAGVPGRPIERPEDGPRPEQIGEPDTGGNLPRLELWFLALTSNLHHPALRGIVACLRLRLAAVPTSSSSAQRQR